MRRRKFLEGGDTHTPPGIGTQRESDVTTESLLTVADLAARWGLSEARTRELVEARTDIPCIDFTAMRPGRKPSRRTPEGAGRGGKREYRFRHEAIAEWESALSEPTIQADAGPQQAPQRRKPSEADSDVARDLQVRTARFRAKAAAGGGG